MNLEDFFTKAKMKFLVTFDLADLVVCLSVCVFGGGGGGFHHGN